MRAIVSNQSVLACAAANVVERLEGRRLLTAGDLDTSFGVGGVVTTDVNAPGGGTDIARAVVVMQADGKIVVAGETSRSGAGTQFALARYNANGTLDVTFGGGDGMVTVDFLGVAAGADIARAMAIQADGKILVAGQAVEAAALGGVNFAVARFNSDGTLDATFGGGDGMVTTDFQGTADSASAMVIQGDGRIIVAGNTDQGIAGGLNVSLARYNADGSLDGTFDGDGRVVTRLSDGADIISALAIQGDGKIVAAGTATEAPELGVANFAVVRYDASGALDVSFGEDGFVTTDFAGIQQLDQGRDVAVLADGRILVAGVASETAGGQNFGLAMYLADGTLDASFGGGDGKATVDFAISIDRASGLVVQADGKFVVGGEVQEPGIGGINFGLARLNSDGSLDATFGGGDGRVSTNIGLTDRINDLFLQADGKIVAAGETNASGTAPNFALARYLPDSPPTARAGGAYGVDEGGSVSLDGSASSDPDQESSTLIYAWDLDGDGIFGESGDGAARGDEIGARPVFSALGLDGGDGAGFNVRLRVTDRDGLSHEDTAAISIRNVTPVITSVTGPGTVDEGTPFTVTVAAQDAGGAQDVLTYHFDFDNDGTYEISGASASASHVYEDNGDYLVNVKVTDGDGGEVRGESMVTVNNVAPTAAITGAPTIKSLPGTTITLGSAVSDPSAADTLTYAWTVTKDGQPVASGTDSTIEFLASETGVYQVTLVVSDDDGGASETQAVSIEVIASSISGIVFADANDNGQVDLGEAGIPSVTVHLSGTDDLGQAVSRTTVTDVDGAYFFLNLRPGNYSVSEEQPAAYTDGKEGVGTAGGTVAPDGFSGIVLGENQDGFNYNFGELPQTTTTPVHSGQTAGIGFWQNKHGQALIKSLNGGPTATALGNWLATSFPNMFGELAGKTNVDVAGFYRERFKLKGTKLDAQVLAVALAVYVTNSNTAGTVAEAYGFVVDGVGLGGASFDVGTSGAAFGVADGTSMQVRQILAATDARAVDGVLYGGDEVLRKLANKVFEGINNSGNNG